jgi:HSP20 family protein
MATSKAARPGPTYREANPQIVTSKDLGALSEAIYQAIGHRAYELYEARGREHGHDLEDWFRAESELRWPGAANVVESSGAVTVTVEPSGFAAAEIKVGIEPRRVIIWGKKTPPAQQEAEKASHTASLRVIDLPSEIDVAKASVKSQDGRLVLKLPAARSW